MGYVANRILSYHLQPVFICVILILFGSGLFFVTVSQKFTFFRNLIIVNSQMINWTKCQTDQTEDGKVKIYKLNVSFHSFLFLDKFSVSLWRESKIYFSINNNWYLIQKHQNFDREP